MDALAAAPGPAEEGRKVKDSRLALVSSILETLSAEGSFSPTTLAKLQGLLALADDESLEGSMSALAELKEAARLKEAKHQEEISAMKAVVLALEDKVKLSMCAGEDSPKEEEG